MIEKMLSYEEYAAEHTSEQIFDNDVSVWQIACWPLECQSELTLGC